MLSIRPIHQELQQIAIEELNENPDTIHEHVQSIREWITSQEHLKVKTDDQSLVSVLRGCKYDAELAKQKIDKMCTMRTNLPELFTNRDPSIPDIQELLDLGICLPLLKTKSPGAPRVLLSRYALVDPHRIQTVNAMKYAIMLGDIMLNEFDDLIIVGCQTVADFNGASLAHRKLIDLRLHKAAYNLYNEAYTVTPKGSYVINVPSFAEVLYNNVFKYMIRPDHRKLVNIYSHGSPKELYDDISHSVLPPEYGGEGDSLEDLTAYWKHKFEEYRDWFLEEELYRADESKRPKTSTGWLGNVFWSS